MYLKKENQGKGYASMLIDSCINDAKAQNMKGVAVVTRNGSFMADKRIFVKRGFEEVDKAQPDFELMALKFSTETASPRFKSEVFEDMSDYREGLTIIRSFQCPYTDKNVNSILVSALTKFNLKTHLVNVQTAESAQNVPCAFGTFCIIYNGEIISHHPISNTRFMDIMTKILNKDEEPEEVNEPVIV